MNRFEITVTDSSKLAFVIELLEQLDFVSFQQTENSESS